MKNVRLLFALALVVAATACSAEPTTSLPQAPRNSTYLGGGTGTPPDTTTPPDKQGS